LELQESLLGRSLFTQIQLLDSDLCFCCSILNCTTINKAETIIDNNDNNNDGDGDDQLISTIDSQFLCRANHIPSLAKHAIQANVRVGFAFVACFQFTARLDQRKATRNAVECNVGCQCA
jgi:hypothetical protein